MKEYLQKLNKEQLKAATTIDGNLLILAGAGSGKTATLISRVAYMLDNNIKPYNILLLTFTNKAAREMQNRIKNYIGDQGDEITATTFHSFCAMFLRKNSHLIGYDANFTILDSVDTLDALSFVKEEFISRASSKGIEYQVKDFPRTKDILRVNEVSINKCQPISKIIDELNLFSYKKEIEEIIGDFKEYKKANNLIDYNDLLFYTKEILSTNEEIRKGMDYRYKYISCDEYQDTNVIQNDILNLLSKDCENLAVVGDDNQSIYKFRCAEIENIMNFSDIKDCEVITLTENYRSSQEILDVANVMMSYATEGIKKDLHGQFNGKKPELLLFPNAFVQSRVLCDMIIDMHNKGKAYKDIAIIERGAAQSFMLEIALNKEGIPFEKFGGIKFLEKPTIKDILAFLKVTINQNDEISLYRILQLYPGIGKKYAKNIASDISKKGFEKTHEIYSKRVFAQYILEIDEMIKSLKTKTVIPQLKYLIDDYYPKLIANVIANIKTSESKKAEKLADARTQIKLANALIDLAKNYRSANSFLSDLTLDATVSDSEEDKLNITTIHSAKGLEYDTVFFLDIAEGITPKKVEDESQDSEERRCAYVAITRAKKELYLTFSEFTQNYQKLDFSHFINNETMDTLNKVVFDYNGYPQ